MTTEHATRKLGVLRQAAYNPRTISAEELGKLKRSIAEFGFVEPVVVRGEDDLIIGGHQRLAAYASLIQDGGGIPEDVDVPVTLVFGLSEARTRALNLALNKISGEWDYSRLAEILVDFAPIDAQLTGFSAQEVDDLIAIAGTPEVFGSPAPSPDMADPPHLPQQKSFSFTVTKADGELIERALSAFGMTNAKTAASAFIGICAAALEARTP